MSKTKPPAGQQDAGWEQDSNLGLSWQQSRVHSTKPDSQVLCHQATLSGSYSITLAWVQLNTLAARNNLSSQVCQENEADTRQSLDTHSLANLMHINKLSQFLYRVGERLIISDFKNYQSKKIRTYIHRLTQQHFCET